MKEKKFTGTFQYSEHFEVDGDEYVRYYFINSFSDPFIWMIPAQRKLSLERGESYTVFGVLAISEV